MCLSVTGPLVASLYIDARAYIWVLNGALMDDVNTSSLRIEHTGVLALQQRSVNDGIDEGVDPASRNLHSTLSENCSH